MDKIFFVLVFACIGSGYSCSWDNCPSFDSENDINVHIIPHTHDDMGWIKTVDDYYTGAKKRLVNVGVQFIYDSVIDELSKDKDRRFVFAEVGFLMRWIHQHGSDVKLIEKFKKLVADGQIEIIGGGWVQPDEAASHYIDLIDQYTLGLQYLNETFGECGKPKVAWQIDPFGHSKEHANLLAQMGYEALFLGRMHFNELEERHQNKSMEFVWAGSDDQRTNIFTGGFYTNSYASPENFCFDQLCADDPVVEDPSLDGYNLPQMAASFVEMVQKRSSVLRHNHLLLLMGGDFQYSNANMYFSQMDLLFKEINKDSASHNVTVRYSIPSCYMRSLKRLYFQVPTKNDDFFPYASSEHQYWTGYYTSKPALKGLIRKVSNFLQLTRMLRVAASLISADHYRDEDTIERAMGLVQHHDAVTGTSKEAVTVDYEKRLLIAMDTVEELTDLAFRTLSHIHHDVKIHFCPLLNETVCDVVNSETVAVTFFNSNSKPIEEVVEIPYYSRSALVQDNNLNDIHSEITKSFRLAEQLLSNQTAPFQITFPVSVPALGYKTYFITKLKSKRNYLSRKNLVKTKYRSPNETVSIENEFIRLDFAQNGLVQSWTDIRTNKTEQFTQQFFYYNGMGQNGTEARTGAYIFRPNGTCPIDLPQPIQIEYFKGELVQEVRQVVSPWISQVIRLRKGDSFAEFEYTVGPLPKEELSPIAKEVITRYTVSGLGNKNIFYTDTNGRQLMQRTVNQSPTFARNVTEPISGNYYPITSQILIQDGQSQLSVLTDRSHGATSLADGQVEVMLHRRAFDDDGWGVDEALDEPGQDGRGLIVKGVHKVLLTQTDKSAYRPKAQDVYHRPLIAFSPIQSVDDYKKNTVTEFSLLSAELPTQLQVITLKALPNNRILLRLEHIYQGTEDVILSQPVTVNLSKLFKFRVASLQETDLSGLTVLQSTSDAVISLSPMQIRTFYLTLE
ncbi:unnamed protein product [Bursaphelenchus okinawaensis]|uniref:Alpha-mannosidase n=1 Tax=Bursaphelenchus okinawaensis TaxID=465554 RepID=A0A811LLT3_9BILA|nr:unnamed protein product [Bursaphelenchus okinawaensis]CAG9126065.1 unnamed protein product [Bursaphelenchus okinawaensis]